MTGFRRSKSPSRARIAAARSAARPKTRLDAGRFALRYAEARGIRPRSRSRSGGAHGFLPRRTDGGGHGADQDGGSDGWVSCWRRSGRDEPIARVGADRRRRPFLLFALLTILAPAPPAAAHAFYESSTPPANAIVLAAPAEVTIDFTEPLESSYSRGELFDEAGNRIDGATSRVADDPYTLVVGLPTGLPNGTYSVLWRTLSTADGHTSQGYLPFTIGTMADVAPVRPPPMAAATTGPPEWVRAASRWLALVGLAAVVAVWPVWLLVLRPAIAPAWQLGPTLTRRVRGYVVGALVLALVGNLVALGVQAAGVGGGAGLLDGLATTLGETRYGTLWLLRIGLLLVYAAALLGVAWWWPRRRPHALAIALLLTAALPVPYSLLSHAAAQSAGSATAVAFDVAHLLGAALWAGGIFLLAVVLPPTLGALTPAGRRVVLMRALPRFSLLALTAWGVLALSGLYSAWLQVGNLTALRETDYGQSLTLKLLLLVPLLALGAFNLLVVTRRLGRAATEEAATGWSGHLVTAMIAESVLLVLVLAVVGLMIGQAPARDELAQNAGRLVIPLEGNDQVGTLYVTPGATGPNRYRLELGSGHEAHLNNPVGTEATLRFELPDQGTGQLELPLTNVGGAFEGRGSQLSIAGNWTIGVTVRAQGQADWQVAVQRPIGETPPLTDLPPPPPRFGPGGIAGVLLLVAGVAALTYAGFAGRSPVRGESAGLGTTALAIGAVLLLQARLSSNEVVAAGDALAFAAPDPAAVERGAGLFRQTCVTCHGPAGRGDGPAAAELSIPPTDLTASHAMVHSDEDVAYWIANGVEGRGMPGFGQVLDDAEIADVIAYVRDVQRAAIAVRQAPGAESCTVPPRSAADLRAWSAAPRSGALAAPAGSASPAAPPALAAELVPEPAAVDGVAETIRQLVACTNAGDPLRRLALFSDRGLRAVVPVAPDAPSAALAAALATPRAVPEDDRIALPDIRNGRRLADGRVAVEATMNPSALAFAGLGAPSPTAPTSPTATPAAPAPTTLIFVAESGRWRIDEVQR